MGWADGRWDKQSRNEEIKKGSSREGWLAEKRR
jgi:hypothetical protein